jgi:choline dehydrogenase-like flavoprotein
MYSRLIDREQLSGIGDKYALAQHGIGSVVHLPGVGTNLQGWCNQVALILHVAEL